MKPAGGTMLGMSRTVRDGKTTEYEFLQIRETSNGLDYVAKPSGQAEATFTAKTIEPGNVVFENPTHDFPQRILYDLRDDGTLLAAIEGPGEAAGSPPRRIEFPFKRD